MTCKNPLEHPILELGHRAAGGRRRAIGEENVARLLQPIRNGPAALDLNTELYVEKLVAESHIRTVYGP
jgi:hypothetical protein